MRFVLMIVFLVMSINHSRSDQMGGFELGFDPENRLPAYPIYVSKYYVAHIGPLMEGTAKQGDPLLLAIIHSDYSFVGRTPTEWKQELPPTEGIENDIPTKFLDKTLGKFDPKGALSLARSNLDAIDSQEMLERLLKVGLFIEVINPQDPRYQRLWEYVINTDYNPETPKEWTGEFNVLKEVDRATGEDNVLLFGGDDFHSLGTVTLKDIIPADKAGQLQHMSQHHLWTSDLFPGVLEKNVKTIPEVLKTFFSDLRDLVREKKDQVKEKVSDLFSSAK